MQTIILLFLLFLIIIFSILLYIKSKTLRLQKLNSGLCPNCGAKPRTFYDEQTKTNFRSDVISARILKTGGCSGVNDVEYKCKECNLKEVHSTNIMPLNTL